MEVAEFILVVTSLTISSYISKACRVADRSFYVSYKSI